MKFKNEKVNEFFILMGYTYVCGVIMLGLLAAIQKVTRKKKETANEVLLRNMANKKAYELREKWRKEDELV